MEEETFIQGSMFSIHFSLPMQLHL